MDNKILKEDIKKMKFLFDVKSGKVISEQKELDEFYGEVVNKKSHSNKEETHIEKVANMLMDAMKEKSWSKVERAIITLTHGKIYK